MARIRKGEDQEGQGSGRARIRKGKDQEGQGSGRARIRKGKGKEGQGSGRARTRFIYTGLSSFWNCANLEGKSEDIMMFPANFK
jgi:hypothetical protein